MKTVIAKIVFLTFLLSLLAFEGVKYRPFEDDYYIEKGYLKQYGTDFLFCGDIAIAACNYGSIGCRVRLTTDVTRKFLHQTFTCINEDKMDGLKVSYKIELPRPRTINIELDIYTDAESSYSVGYGLRGDEFASGVIALDKLEEMKRTFRQEKQRVDG